MSKSPSQYYSYAQDIDGKLTHISNAEKKKQYFCPHCKTLVIPRMGKVRQWHFAHKASIENCCYETYLHKIAKIKIKEAFLNSSEFIISFSVLDICSNRDLCKFYNTHKCISIGKIEHNLKKYYDICEEETPYKNFVADLLISSSSNPDREPILIEIYVTHKCSIEKINDGVRIIEVRIENEEDINRIISTKKIEGEKSGDKSYLLYRCVRSQNIFYHFKGNKKVEPEFFNKKSPRYLYYFWISKSGFFKADKCLCSEDPTIKIPYETHYIISPIQFSWAWALLEISKIEVPIVNCLICEHFRYEYRKRICLISEEEGTPRSPKINAVKECQHFKKITHAQKISKDYELDDITIIGYWNPNKIKNENEFLIL